MTPIRTQFKQLLQGSLLGRALGALGNFILARALGVSEFGAFSLYLQLIQTCEMLSRIGLDYSLSYWISPDPKLHLSKSRYLVRTALIISIGLALCSAIFAGVYIGVPIFRFPWPHEQSANNIFRFLILIAILSECLSSLPWELLLIQQKISKANLRQILFGPLKLLGAGLSAIFWQLEGALALWVCVSCMQLVWLFKELPRQAIAGRLHRRIARVCASLLVGKGFFFYSSNLISQLVFFPLLLAVAASNGVDEVSYLRIGQICSQLFGLASGALAPLLFIKLRSTHDQNARDILLNKSLSISWMFSISTLATFFIFDHLVISIAFGSTYIEGIPATRVFVCCTVLDSISQIIQQSLLADGKVKQFSVIQNTSCVASAVAGWLLVPSYGLTGFLISRGLYSLLPAIGTIAVAKILQPSLEVDWRLALGTGLLVLTAALSISTGMNSSPIHASFALSGITLILCFFSFMGREFPRFER